MATVSENSVSSPNTKHKIKLRIMRGDTKGQQKADEFKVPYAPGMVVLDAIRWVQENDTPDLAVRWNCKAAHCGAGSAEFNGRPRLLCKTRGDEFGSQPFTVAPMKAFPLIKDLVTDVSWNYDSGQDDSPF